nr:DNA (cytosine-5)-methyltransferase CMT2 [Ipomoea batatas]
MEQKPPTSPTTSSPIISVPNPTPSDTIITESADNRTALALSLYVHPENEPLPLPLKVCYPDSDSPAPITSPRRSSRSTSNKYRSECVSPALSSKATPTRRLSLTSPLTVGMSLEFPNKRRRIDAGASEKTVVRRSPRLSQTESEGKLLALPDPEPKRHSRKKESNEVAHVGTQREQLEKIDSERSPKVEPVSIALSDKGHDSPKTTSKREALTGDSEVDPKFASPERRASVTSDLVPTDDMTEPVSSELSDSGEESELEEGNSGVKCLRSRKIQFPVVSERNAEKTPAFSNGCGVDSKDSTTKGNESCTSSKRKEKNKRQVACFIGEPIPTEEAQERWRWRYDLKSQRSKKQGWILNADEEDEVILNVDCHYAQAKVLNFILNIGDCVYVKGEGEKKHVGRILEFFKTTEGEDYFRVQWFFRAEDTVMRDAAALHDKKRLFYSTLMNDNLLDCIISKVNVTEISPGLGLEVNKRPLSGFYYDMEYCVDYSTFRNLPTVQSVNNWDSPSLIDASYKPITAYPVEHFKSCEPTKVELSLLDLYAGCGGMSTGLCLGAKLSGLNLVTKWAVDYEKSACDSLKCNHPETQVRNESVENFLKLLKEWEKLCKKYGSEPYAGSDDVLEDMEEGEDDANSLADSDDSDAEYEILRLVDICFGDPNDTGKPGIHFQVRWKGYGPSEDTWEPIDGLKDGQESIHDFVRRGKISKLLPLPGDVDVICGGPPCQGISGYNRHRNVSAPLDDERNRQIIVFMDVVEFLRPKYVLMENVPDILRFDKASLGRYALSRLVHVRYQARLGILAAGCYGLPQFRLRVFILGALPSEKLPPFPLPTHDVIVRYWPPPEFERNTVAYDEGQPRELEEALVLRDAISDLPAVTCREDREEMPYHMPPESDFQKYIRLPKHEMMGAPSTEVREMKDPVLYDHRPRLISDDDIMRISLIPHKKGANFLDFPGVILVNNTARRDPNKEPVLLPSGRPLVPDCLFTYKQGKSKRPFARLWWDETVATLVTFPNCRSHVVLHPDQDRVLTVREYARLQGFPDFYRFCGTVTERYCQLGNAVAIPVGRALGYALGIAFQRLSGDEPLMKLPPKFAFLQPPVDEIVELRN